MLAISLETNTNLRLLSLVENLITRDGFNALFFALCDCRSFNALHASNHTCRVVGAGDDHPIKLTNIYLDINLNRKVKMLGALLTAYSHAGDYKLSDLPAQVMPGVLAFAQGEGVLDVFKHNRLNALFTLTLREWNMPLLYTSRIIRPKPRTSDGRIRKINVTSLKRVLILCLAFRCPCV